MFLTTHHRNIKVKLYFMLGLPTETKEDMEEIAVLSDNIARVYYAEIPKEQRNVTFRRRWDPASGANVRLLFLISCTLLITSKPLVPFIKATQDRVVLEIQRGCIRGCRFCQAGEVYNYSASSCFLIFFIRIYQIKIDRFPFSDIKQIKKFR